MTNRHPLALPLGLLLITLLGLNCTGVADQAVSGAQGSNSQADSTAAGTLDAGTLDAGTLDVGAPSTALDATDTALGSRPISEDADTAQGHALDASSNEQDSTVAGATWDPTKKQTFGTPAAWVEVPAHALPTALPITVTAAQSASPGYIGQAWDFGPDATKFSKPVRITLKMDAATLGATEVKMVRLAVLTGGSWQVLEASGVDTATLKVWGDTTHFSMYAPVALPAPCSAAVALNPDGSCDCSVKSYRAANGLGPAYGYCKALFVGALSPACKETGYAVHAANSGCCMTVVDSLGGSAVYDKTTAPVACMAAAGCAAVTADPMGVAAACKAFK